MTDGAEVRGGEEPVVVMLGAGTTEALADALSCAPGDAVGIVAGAAGFVEAGGGVVALAAESAPGLAVLALRSPPEDMAGSVEPVPPMMCAGEEPVGSFFLFEFSGCGGLCERFAEGWKTGGRRRVERWRVPLTFIDGARQVCSKG